MAGLPFRLGFGRPTIDRLGPERVVELARRPSASDERQQRGGVRRETLQRNRLGSAPLEDVVPVAHRPVAYHDTGASRGRGEASQLRQGREGRRYARLLF